MAVKKIGRASEPGETASASEWWEREMAVRCHGLDRGRIAGPIGERK
jgi:hypothetical protein